MGRCARRFYTFCGEGGWLTARYWPAKKFHGSLASETLITPLPAVAAVSLGPTSAVLRFVVAPKAATTAAAALAPLEAICTVKV